MATETLPAKINTQWLKQQTTVLGCTAKKINGQPNPRHAELAAEIEAAKAELARRDAFEAWVKKTSGAVLSQYPTRTGGQVYEAGQAFVAKDAISGKWQFVVSLQDAWEQYLTTTVGS